MKEVRVPQGVSSLVLHSVRGIHIVMVAGKEDDSIFLLIGIPDRIQNLLDLAVNKRSADLELVARTV